MRNHRVSAARVRVALLAACALALLARAPRAEDGVTSIDAGRFIVSADGKPARYEDFSLDQAGDSVIVRSSSSVARSAAAGGALPADKTMWFTANASDMALRSYLSVQIMGPDTTRHGLEFGGSDTVYSAYHEHNGLGVGDRLVTPPGRLYVLDPPLFITFDLICRSMQPRTFDRWPVTVMVMGRSDTLVESTVTSLGREPLRWGAATVSARKYRISDANTSFLAWAAPDGKLLRLVMPQSGLEVDREPPRTRRPAARRPAAKKP